MIVVKAVSSSGEVGYFKDSDFFRNDKLHTRSSRLGYNLGYDSKNPFYAISWTYNDNKIFVFLLGPNSDFLYDSSKKIFIASAFDVIVFKDDEVKKLSTNKENFWAPYVINPDGSINHQIKPPKYIYNRSDIPSDTFLPKNKLEELMAANKSLVEGIDDVDFDKESNNLIIRLSYFGWEWYQERLYNAETQEWGEIVSSGRY